MKQWSPSGGWRNSRAGNSSMSVCLLELTGGGVSLEFDDADFENVRASIAALFGEIRTVEKTPSYSEVEFSGERFVYLHEWTPCLMSRSEKGREMLQAIAAHCLIEPAKDTNREHSDG